MPRVKPTPAPRSHLRLHVDPPLDHVPMLSLRKWEIVALLAMGREYGEVGRLLGISPRTVLGHVHAIARCLPRGRGQPLTRVLLYARELLALRVKLDADRE